MEQPPPQQASRGELGKAPRHTCHDLICQGDLINSLSTLPNEILLQVFSYVDVHRSARVLGYIPDDPPPSPPDEYLVSDFRASCRSLLGVALTCRRFAVLIPEVLFSTLVLELSIPETWNDLPGSDIFGLIPIFHARPEWKRHVKQLRLCIPKSEHGFSIIRDLVHEKALDFINSLDFPVEFKEGWSQQLEISLAWTFAFVLLALLPNVVTLCISDRKSRLAFGEANTDQPEKAMGLIRQRLPVSHMLSYVKFESPLPPVLRGLDNVPNLHTLDLSIKLQGQLLSSVRYYSEFYLDGSCEQPSIQRLRLDFEVKSVGVWSVPSRRCMTNIIRGFPNLRTLEYYAESSDCKNPYRSVRAFPAYQSNIQKYPDASSAFADDVYIDEQHWDRAIYDARTEVTDYQNLVDGMVHLRPNLETLQLPGGFWTLPGAVRKPLPRFDQFVQLKKLVVPQAAIISIKLDNMRFDAIFEGDFELSPMQALPTCLQHLKIFDVDLAFLESKWLQDLFDEQKTKNQWPVLKCVEILMGPTISESSLRHLQARESGDEFWKLAGNANFEVVMGRDEEGPDV
jgi:hypothetical protein